MISKSANFTRWKIISAPNQAIMWAAKWMGRVKEVTYRVNSIVTWDLVSLAGDAISANLRSYWIVQSYIMEVSLLDNMQLHCDHSCAGYQGLSFTLWYINSNGLCRFGDKWMNTIELSQAHSSLSLCLHTISTLIQGNAIRWFSSNPGDFRWL